MSQTPAKSARSPQTPAGIFTITSSTGKVCDLTSLILDGAKLTMLFSQLCYSWGISYNLKRAEYHQLRRACKTWESSGLVTYETQTYDSCFVGIDQRSGIFVRATSRTPPNTPNLIRSLQNSKSFAAPQFEPRLDKDEPLNLSSCQDERDIWKQMYAPQDEIHPDYLLPGGRISWLRMQAIRKCMGISDPNLFVRVKTADDKTIINPQLKKKQNEIQRLFEAWKRESKLKSIVLKNTASASTLDPYLVLDYKTRFTDLSRHIKNRDTYRDAIAQSLEMFKTGVFITLTTDPQVQMKPRGEEFTRHFSIEDKKTEKKIHYEFDATGQGRNLWSANRSESRAWRGWYERLCHRFGERVPYIRVVEFQKNGLIHTHLLLFGIEWNTSWEQLAKDWGSRYNMGYMNQVYKIENRDNKWQWIKKEEQPNDTKGRDPADYLGKYLKKAQDVPTVKCPTCGQIVSSNDEDYLTCPKCGQKIKAPKDPRYMYWVCGKRFFTISQCLRIQDFDAEIAEADRKARQTAVWEFLGAPHTNEVDELIQTDIPPSKPATMDGWESPIAKMKKEKLPEMGYVLPPSEDPDINDDEISEILRESVPKDLDPARTAYEQQLAAEARWQKERRDRLQKTKEKEK